VEWVAENRHHSTSKITTFWIMEFGN